MTAPLPLKRGMRVRCKADHLREHKGTVKHQEGLIVQWKCDICGDAQGWRSHLRKLPDTKEG
jgi:hypothetical protein